MEDKCKNSCGSEKHELWNSTVAPFQWQWLNSVFHPGCQFWPSRSIYPNVKPSGHPPTRCRLIWDKCPNRRVEHEPVLLLEWHLCLWVQVMISSPKLSVHDTFWHCFFLRVHIHMQASCNFLWANFHFILFQTFTIKSVSSVQVPLVASVHLR